MDEKKTMWTKYDDGKMVVARWDSLGEGYAEIDLNSPPSDIVAFMDDHDCATFTIEQSDD